MTLHDPHYLLLLLLLPGLVYLRYGRRRRNTLRFSDGQTLSRLQPTLLVVAQPLLPILYTCGVALLILVLARPQRGLDESVVRTDAVDIVLLVDVSSSMLAEDLAETGVNRLDAAKRVMERFIKGRPNDRIGMVAFSGLPYSVSPLTLDHDWLIERIRLPSFKPGMLPQDRTAIGDAIASGVNRLRDSEARSKLIILLTDGINNAGSLTPDNAAQAAKALGIKVYTIGAGTTGPARIPIDHPIFGRRYTYEELPLDEESLKRIADITDAKYFRATNVHDLADVYEQIDRMEKTEIEVEKFTRFEEAFAPFLACGLLLLGLEKLLSLTRFGRLP